MGRHILVLLGLLLLTTALFWRVLFLGETFIDLAAHSRQLPWGDKIEGYEDYPFNHRDLTDTYVTRDYFLVESYRRGEMPLWNPYNLSGHPIYADGVTRPYAPTNLFYLWFDVPLGYSLARLVEYYLAVAFLYVFLVGIGLRPVAAGTGALAFLLSDHLLYHLTWIGWTGGLMWLPLALLGAELAMRKQSWGAAVGAGLAFAMQFYTGFIPATIYYLGALVLYYILTPLLSESSRRLKRSLLYLTTTLVVGFGLSAPVWMPVFELLGYSNRKIVPTELGYIWIPPWHLVTLLLPRAFGEAFDPRYLRMFVEMGVSQERSLYLGLTALPLILLALTARKDRRVYYFAGLMLLAVLTVTCAPLYVHFTKYIPVLKTIRAITRVSCLYALAASVLIAYGAQALMEARREELERFLKWLRRGCLGWIGMLLILAPVTFYLSRYLPQDYEAGSRLRRWPLKVLAAFSMQFDPHNYGLIVPLLVVLLLLSLTLLRLSARHIWAAMVILLALELIWNGAQYNRTYPRSQVYAPTAATEFLRSRLGHERVLVTPSEIGGKTSDRGRRIVAPPNTLIPYEIATISGKDQLFPKWYRALAALVEPQEDLSHVVFDSPRSPVYDLLGVRYLMTKERLEGYREVFAGEGVRIYENPAALPRAFFAPEVLSVKTQAERLLKGLDLKRTVVVEGELGVITGATGQESVRIVDYGRNRVVMETSSPVNGSQLLILTDTWYPGWEASVDGRPAQVLRADGALRAVVLPGGAHRVEMRFRPRSLWRGLWTAGIVSSLLLSAAIYRRWKSGRMDRT